VGREIRRVPLDFDWPQNKIWDGFLNPHYEHQKQCPHCDGTGYNPETKKIYDDWYDFAGTGRRWCSNITQHEVDALIEGNRFWNFTRTCTKEHGWQDRDPKPRVTAEMVNEWSKRGMGHDAINCHICVRARAEREGVYGSCVACSGSGESWRAPEDKAAAEKWEKTDPPAGPGWQLWETVSEGSPISPVFPTKGEFVEWLVSEGYSEEAAVKFADVGWAPSAVLCNGKLKVNIESVTCAE